jgi:hypothetical protein
MNHPQSRPLRFTPDDFSEQLRSALASLELVGQVLLNSGALLEQVLGRSLNPPAPKRMRYPHDPGTLPVRARPNGRVNRPVVAVAPDEPPEPAQVVPLPHRPTLKNAE